MAESITFNNAVYVIPDVGESNWGQNLTNYFVAVPQGCYQLSGGTAPLTADLNFGTNFGLFSKYLSSVTSTPATAGMIRLAKTDALEWRNNANSANITLSLDGSDNPQVGSSKILLSGAVVNADINASAAIARSKLDFGSGLVNADIAAAAAIAVNKLAALTASRAMATDGSGFASASAVTATELGYVSGVTSAIQTQLNATISNPLTSNLAGGSHNITGVNLGQAVSFRATGATIGASDPSLELLYSSGGIIQAYDRTAGSYLGLSLSCISLNASYDGGAHNMLLGSSAGVSILGTNTNDSAAAGFVGEEVRAAVSSTSFPATTVFGDLASISLTAGDWDVSVNLLGLPNGATWTQFETGISITSGNSSTGLVGGDNDSVGIPGATVNQSICVPTYRMSFSTTTTVYLKYMATYSAGTPKAFGRISARRMR